jgi:alanyl-tRNA synthetase
MSNQVNEILRKAAVIKDGKPKLPCKRAFQLADELGLTLKEIGEICNSEGIKIINCQLGCFP